MTATAPDLPDWVKQDSAGTVFVDTALLTSGSSQVFGLTGVASYVIVAVAPVGADVILSLEYDGGAFFPAAIAIAAVTMMGIAGFATQLPYETPSYSGQVTITNTNPSDLVDVFVLSSNRVVNEPRILTDIIPGREFSGGGGAWVAATPFLVFPADGFAYGYTANFEAGITIKATGDGELTFRYLKARLGPAEIKIADVVGGVDQTVQVALPQCIGQFWFTPIVTNAANTVTVIASPVRN